jgi:hypothetical protein
VELSHTNISIRVRQGTCRESGREMVFGSAAVPNIQSFLLTEKKRNRRLNSASQDGGQAGTQIHVKYSNIE